MTDLEGHVPTKAQAAVRERFRQAALYGKMVIADPATKTLYEEAVKAHTSSGSVQAGSRSSALHFTSTGSVRATSSVQAAWLWMGARPAEELTARVRTGCAEQRVWTMDCYHFLHVRGTALRI